MTPYRILLFLTLMSMAGCKASRQVAETPAVPPSENGSPGYTFAGGRPGPSVDENFVEACTYMMRGDLSSAEDMFLTVLEADPEHHASHYNLAKIQLENREFSTALEHIRTAIQLDDNDWYRRLLVQVYERQGNLRRALEEQQRLHESLPMDRGIWIHLSELQYRLGQEEEALTTLNQIHETLGKSAKSLMMQYQWHMDRRDYAAAAETASELLSMDPSNGQWQNMRYNALVKSGDEAAAMASLEAWLLADPGNGQAQTLMADAYERAGQQELAREWIGKAMANPDLSAEWKAAYLEDRLSRDLDSDQQMLEYISILRETHPEAAEATAFEARLAVESQPADSARKLLRIATDADPASLDTWKQLLDLDFNSGRYDFLYLDSREAREMFPNNETILLYYGIGAAANGEYSRAIRGLSKIVLIEPDDQILHARALGELARLNWMMGEQEEAEEMLKQAQALAGDDAFVGSREALLVMRGEETVIQLFGSPDPLPEIRTTLPDRPYWVLFFGNRAIPRKASAFFRKLPTRWKQQNGSFTSARSPLNLE